MSWFNQLSQGSYQQQPTGPTDTYSPASHTAGPGAQNVGGAGCFSPSPLNFPSAPRRGAATPLSLEDLSCASPSTAGHLREPEPVSYVTLQEQRCVLSWFHSWTSAQKERFLHDLLGKAVPGKVCTLLDSLSSLQVPPVPMPRFLV